MPKLFKHLRANVTAVSRVFWPAPFSPTVYDASYVQRAAAHAITTASLEEQRLVREWLSASRPGTILDIGCNSGQPLASLSASLDADGTGIDINRAAIAKAVREQPNVSFELYDGGGLPFPDATFDHVMLHHSLGHVADAALQIRESARVLRSGGTLSVITPNAHYKLWQFPFDVARDFLPDLTALRFFTAGSLGRLLRREGFGIERIARHGRFPSWCPPGVRRVGQLQVIVLARKAAGVAGEASGSGLDAAGASDHRWWFEELRKRAALWRSRVEVPMSSQVPSAFRRKDQSVLR